MKNKFKKRGQKYIRKFYRTSAQVSEGSKEHIKENLIERISHIENIRLLILEWGLTIVALIMLAVTQAFWFGDSYAEDVFTTGGTYTEATLGAVNSLNPLFATTDSEKVLSRLLFATLTTIDYSGNPGTALAASVLPNETGKIWTIKLKEGLKWSDNEPITNEDVLFTAQLIKNSAVNSIYDSNLSNVKISENGNGEIVFELPTAYADFISALNIPILPKHVLENTDPKTLNEDNFSVAPTTSGAFNLNAVQNDTRGEEKVFYLSANPNYYKGKTMLGGFAVHTYNTKEAIIEAINSGAVTATAELSGLDAEKITANQFYRKDSSINSGAFVFFNLANENIKSKELRAAIREGLDLTKIRALASETAPLDYPLLASQITIENYPSLPGYDFNKAKAKIAELSDGETLHLEVATVNSGYLSVVTNEVVEELRSLGIDVNVIYYEEDQDFVNNVVSKRNYDLLVYEVELGADPDPLPYYHSSQASASGLNLSNYRNTLVDDLLLGARDSLDEALRAKKYETFLEYWASAVPAIGLYQTNLTYYYNKNVRTFGNDIVLVTTLDRFTDVGEWAVTKTTKNRTP